MYYHNNELPPQQGWICPKCGRVNAPWMPTCGCVSSQTSGTGAPYLVKTIPISRDSHEVDTPQTDCETCKHYKLACELFSEICKYEPTTQTETQNSNSSFE